MSLSPHVFNATQDNFEADVLEASFQTPVLVDFWAPWCGPCKMLMPVLEKLATEANGAIKLAKVNTDEEMAVAGSFGIRSLPTVVLFKDGRPVDGFMGAQPEGAIRAMLAKHLLPAEPDAAEELPADAGQEDLEAVVAELEAAIQAEPEKAELRADLADALLRGGAVEEAAALLAELPASVENHDSTLRAKARLGFLEAALIPDSDNELQERIGRDDLQARYVLGCRFVLGGMPEAGMDQFLTILKTDRGFENDLGRRALLQAFRLITDDDLVGNYRRRMTSLLF